MNQGQHRHQHEPHANNDHVVARGPMSRAQVSPELIDALRGAYGIQGSGEWKDLGGSSNLNLLVVQGPTETPLVVRVFRPWVTPARLADMQRARAQLSEGGVPAARPVLTLGGDPWVTVGDRLVEAETYVEHDGKMDSWERLEIGLPLLGRTHTLLRSFDAGEDGRNPPAANYIGPRDALAGTMRGTREIRRWTDASRADLQLADNSEELARLVDYSERESGVEGLPRQIVHGDYWDNNVLFRGERVVLVTDLDFMGERARIDDLALTLYYTNSTFSQDPLSDDRLKRLHALVDAYNSGLDEPLSRDERAALPLALARTTLAFIAMIPSVDSPAGARRLAAEMLPDIGWALAIVRDLDRWRTAFA
jgi:homoserine kinase type II